MTAPLKCTPTEAMRLASRINHRNPGRKTTPLREQAIVDSILRTEHSTADLQETGGQNMIRPCPECGAGVESDTVKANALKTYTCSQCGAKLWLIQSALSDRLVVAQVRQ